MNVSSISCKNYDISQRNYNTSFGLIKMEPNLYFNSSRPFAQTVQNLRIGKTVDKTPANDRFAARFNSLFNSLNELENVIAISNDGVKYADREGALKLIPYISSLDAIFSQILKELNPKKYAEHCRNFDITM
ncbi:MAG: hypothetical protein MJ237_03190 [bacterium]|nr:hypothetical protein [bacterium]